MKKLMGDSQGVAAAGGTYTWGPQEIGLGRFAAEHWLCSHPSLVPCDAYPGAEFSWGYDHMPGSDGVPEAWTPMTQVFTTRNVPLGHFCKAGLFDQNLTKVKLWRSFEWKGLYPTYPATAANPLRDYYEAQRGGLCSEQR